MKIMKNITLLLSLLSFASGLNLSAMDVPQPQLSSNNIYGNATPIDPQNTVLIWDLDDVVVDKNMKWVIASYLANPLWWPTLRRTQALQAELKKLIGSGAGAEGIIAYAKAKGDNAVAQFVNDVANTKTINLGVANVIKDVSAQGIKEYVASNMGQEGYAQIMKGTTPADAQIAAVFNAYFTGTPQLVDYSQVPELAKNPEAKIIILKKPNPEFFTTFLARNNIDPQTVRGIFIDDKRENVIAWLKAAGANATGIVFKDSGQLRTDLEALRVLVNQNSEPLAIISQ